jgi:hypothetical protein
LTLVGYSISFMLHDYALQEQQELEEEQEQEQDQERTNSVM